MCIRDRLRIHVRLSQQPPDFTEENIIYIIGGYDTYEEEEMSVVIPLDGIKMGEWNVIHLNLTEDARKYAKGGLDNAFSWISLILDSRKGEFVEVYIDDFRIDQTYNCQYAFDLQKEMASRMARHYGITVHVGVELSASTHHMCAFGSWIPIIDLNLRSREYTLEEVVEYVKAYGGAISLCHPFSKWKGSELSEEEKEKVVKEAINLYVENRCFGVDLLEVGFPDGRHGFPIESYLKLWDELSRAGIIVTGIGVSDAHNNLSGWFSGNNFVNWIRARSVKEIDLIKGLLSGDVYMSDPTAFRGTLEFMTTDGYHMGQIIVGKKRAEIILRLFGCKPGWKINWIVNGELKNILSVDEEVFYFKGTINVQGFTFTRFEVYDGERCILLTNPIYFAENIMSGLPKHRVVKQLDV